MDLPHDFAPMVFRRDEDRIHVLAQSWAAIEDSGLDGEVFSVLEAEDLSGLERWLQEHGYEYRKTHGGSVFDEFGLDMDKVEHIIVDGSGAPPP